MLDFPRWRVWMLTSLMVVAVAFAIPSLLPAQMRAQLAQFMPTPTINLGLDLAGGSHILLEADTSQLAETRLETLKTACAPQCVVQNRKSLYQMFRAPMGS